ncbi:MAG: chromosome segregation protein SMC [Clostridia bacterium]|nr:chromosome segregation protein SMC [Clostridia bacterium]
MVQFKKIKLIGFKSFADKTEIPLTDGVTCIVGPNGCGKSNVADAIRWVLGEQSAKVMRGSNMMDVIFNGTEKRKKTSFCEVTLTFDNTNRIFDYDADEIEMTRRLYRDGTSEYLLNQQPSRMKILTGLLHGAGAAKEGYSIIGQGRIAQIMNSRPEERRSIFEEATGIVVFKDRKAEAERKLNYSKDNLFVFAQRMAEVERQLTPLAKAAENAKKYNALYETLRMNEINTYIFRHDGAAGEREKIDARINKLNSQIKHNSELAASLLSEYEECRGLLAGADDKLKRLNEERLEYTVGLERSTGESKVFKERANAVKYKLQQAQDDIVFATKRIGDVDKGIRRCEEYANKNGERIEKLRETCAQLQSDIVRLTESIASYELSTNEHRKRVMDAFRDLSEIKENIGSLSAKKELLKERLAEMDDAMQNVRAEHEKLKAEYDKTLKAQESLNAYLGDENVLMENAAAAVSAASDKVQALVRKIYDSEAQISSLQQSLRTYTALRDRFEGYVYSVRRLMSDAKENPKLSSRIMGLIADVVSCDKGYEIAIETAFGGAMQNVITETREDAQFLIEYLKSNRAGQVTFLPIDALRPRLESAQIKSACSERGAVGLAIDLVHYDKKYDNVIHNLLGNTLVCEDIAAATVIARRYPRAFKIVTLDGDIIATSGSMTGGSRRENSANLLANERKIKEIEDEITLRKNTLTTAENKRAEAESELERARGEREALDGKLQQARLELAAAKEKLSSLTFNIADKESEYSVYRQSKAQVEEKLAELDSEYSSTSKGASTLSEQSTKATSEIDSLSEENDKIVKERNDKAARLNALQVEIASLESAMKSNMDSAERTRAEKAELIERVSNLRTLLPELQKQFDEWNEKAARAALTKDEQVKLDDLNERIAEVEKSKKQLNDRVAEIDKSRFETAELLEELNNKLHNQEMAMQKIDSDLEFLQQRIEEEYHEDYEGCLKYKVENFDVGAASSAIINCKRQITMIGAVNPTAIEDYEAVSTRYERMTEERQDLEKAIADLEHALEDIRSEMLKIFDAGFNTINENFKRTFKELFGGGRAELQLDYTNCEDPLDAGVEIVACPPGKNLAKISLLSGGEQALTAIAILFAIIQMRPMPFCVLDEIEAALDDANVGRYATYLKKFAAQTQFIVITHRKPTMEKADVLFGVTMEEKGVSKIVSVKLSEVESRLGGDTVS